MDALRKMATGMSDAVDAVRRALVVRTCVLLELAYSLDSTALAVLTALEAWSMRGLDPVEPLRLVAAAAWAWLVGRG